MKYWVRSCPPLVYRAAWIETTCELIHWIEEILEKSWEVSRKEKRPLIPRKEKKGNPFDLFHEGFVVKKVYEERWEKILKGDLYFLSKRKKRFPYIEGELNRLSKSKSSGETRGRKKKITMKPLEDLYAKAHASQRNMEG